MSFASAASIVAALTSLSLLAAAPAAEQKSGQDYKIEVVTTTAKVGVPATAKLIIKAGEGYKWNKEYPAKATVASAPDTLVVTKREFKQLKGDFAAEKKLATVTIEYKGKSAGTQTLRVDTKFSVCSDKVCLLKKASTDIALVIE